MLKTHMQTFVLNLSIISEINQKEYINPKIFQNLLLKGRSISVTEHILCFYQLSIENSKIYM